MKAGRLMYIRREKLLPVMTIIRMRRGLMMGVDQNRNMEMGGVIGGVVFGVGEFGVSH
jgi:hypothetical protein